MSVREHKERVTQINIRMLARERESNTGKKETDTRTKDKKRYSRKYESVPGRERTIQNKYQYQ